MKKISLNEDNRHLLALMLSKSLTFDLISCGITHKALPYTETWRVRGDGYISHVSGANSTVYQHDLPPLRVNDGQTIITRPFWQHRSETLRNCDQQDCVFTWAHFNFYILDNVDIFTFFELPQVFDGEKSDVLRNFCSELYRIQNDSTQSPLGEAIEIKKIAFNFLYTLFQFMPLRRTLNEQLWKEINIIEPALKHIDKNVTHTLHINDLAELCNISVSAFYAIFKRVTQSSPAHYIIMRRLKLAQKLLTSSQLSIKEIALKTGYDDPFFFSKIFKKHSGSTPSDYRSRLHCGIDGEPIR
jgi:AraC-like DNA-binding protein